MDCCQLPVGSPHSASDDSAPPLVTFNPEPVVSTMENLAHMVAKRMGGKVRVSRSWDRGWLPRKSANPILPGFR